MYLVTKADNYTTNIQVLAASETQTAAWEKIHAAFTAKLQEQNDTEEPDDKPIPIPSLEEAAPHWCYNQGESLALFITASYATIVADGDLTYFCLGKFPEEGMGALCRCALDYMLANCDGLSLTGKQKSQLENILQKI